MGKHSAESQKKRKINNPVERIPRTIYSLVTKGSKAEHFDELTPQHVKGTRRYVDTLDGHLVIKLQNFIPENDYKPLLEFMLDNDNCIGSRISNRRGLGVAAHLGLWTTRGGKNFKLARPTKETTGPLARKMMKLAAPIARIAGDAVRAMFPGMATNLSTIPAQFRPFDLWPLMIGNFLAPQSAHRDYEDYSAGFCVVAPLGVFNGGEIYFEELNLTIPVHNGDLIMFRSDLLTHQVLPSKGLRMSVIFTTHQRFMKWVTKDYRQSAQRKSESLEDVIDAVVDWGEHIATCPMLEEDEELDEPVVTFPRVQGHNAHPDHHDSYDEVDIPENILQVRQEREKEKKDC